MLVPAAAFGLAIGASLAMLRGGGSILAVPALVYGLGQPVAAAVPTSLLVVGGSAAAGAISHLRSGSVPWRSALLFGGSGILGSFGGAQVGRQLEDRLLLVGFAALMLVAAAAMLRRRSSDQGKEAAASCENAWRERPLAVIAVGAGVGLLTGLFGVGGGFIIVPAWTLAMGCPVRVSVGVSLVVIVINSAAAFFPQLGFPGLDVPIATAFTLAAIAGALVGGRFAERFEGVPIAEVVRLSRGGRCGVRPGPSLCLRQRSSFLEEKEESWIPRPFQPIRAR